MFSFVSLIVPAMVVTGCFGQTETYDESSPNVIEERKDTRKNDISESNGNKIGKPGVWIYKYPELAYCDRTKHRLQCASDCKTLLVCEPNSNRLPLINVTCAGNTPDCDLEENKCVKRRPDSQCPEEPGRGWICPFSNGYFPDPSNFSQYFFCDNDVPVHNYECMKNLVYNTTASICQYPRDGQLTFVSCENDVAVHPDDRSLYLFCKNNLLIRESYQKCPFFTYFNSKSLSCEFKCSERGNFKDHESSNKFYSCAFDESSGEFISDHVTCPLVYSYFNEDTGTCENSRELLKKDGDINTLRNLNYRTTPTTRNLRRVVFTADSPVRMMSPPPETEMEVEESFQIKRWHTLHSFVLQKKNWFTEMRDVGVESSKHPEKLSGSRTCTPNNPGMQCSWDCKTMLVCPPKASASAFLEEHGGRPLTQFPCPAEKPFCDIVLNKCVENQHPEQCASPTAEEYSCPGEEGYFPDPTDCHKYYFCSKSEPTSRYICPEKYVYNYSGNNCTSNTTTCDVLECTDSTIALYPRDNSLFAFCDQGKVMRKSFQKCPYPNQEMNVTTYGCEFVCRHEGSMADPQNAKRYYTCLATGTNGELEISEQKCPKKHRFDPVTLKCVT